MDNAHLRKTWKRAVDALGKQKHDEALVHLRKIQRAIPIDADVQFALADALAGLGKIAAAVIECKKGLEQSRDSIDGWIRLGRLYLLSEKPEEARGALDQALKTDPKSLHGLVGRAEALAMADEFETAERDLLEALGIAPNSAEILIALARVQDASGDQKKAEATLRGACAAYPDQLALWISLGFALRGWDRLEDANATREEARKHHPHSLELMAQSADFAYEMRDLERAKMLYHELLEQNPNNPLLLTDLAQVLASLGEEQEAMKLFRDLTKRFPLLTQSWLNISRAKRFTDSDDPDLRQMRSLVKRSQLPIDQLSNLHFALGKAYDDLADYDRAFSHYREANALHRRQIRFDPNEVSSQFARLILAFSAEKISNLSASGSPSTRPVFVLGMPRSGTTLLEQVLCAHPEVETAGELRDLSRIAREFSLVQTDPWPECLRAITSKDVSNMAEEYLGALQGRASAGLRVIDKMPQNFIHAGLAAILFPNAVLIHCMRDPMDTCLSIFFQIFPRGIDFAYDLTELGQYYQSYQRLMSHWHEVLGERLIRVSYENLVTKPEAELRGLLDKMNLPWTDAVLTHQEQVSRVDTLSLYQVRQPLNIGSKERWRNYESHLDALRQGLAA